MSDMKHCPTCGETKPVSEFSKEKAKKDGYQAHCKTCNKEHSKEYYGANKAAIEAKHKEYRQANKVARAAKQKEYRQTNKDKVNSHTAKRKALKLRATPVWSDLGAISELYTCALAFKVYTGREYHVDHIVPLKSKLVCGLHVPANLQVLEASENISKGNRYWPDMP